MHGTEFCNQARRVLVPPTPRRLRWKATVQCRQAHLPVILIGTGISKRPFTLLKRLSASGPPFQGRRSRPTPSMPRQATAAPVRFPIPSRAPVRPGRRTRSLPKTRCPTIVRQSRLFLGSPLPFGVFRTKHPDQSRSTPIPGRKVHLLNTLDCPSLPGYEPILLATMPDHRSRLASRSAACCSTDLLEPISSSTRSYVTVK